jgi:predicted TIM-barrel fold metal-dependent hydrolase
VRRRRQAAFGSALNRREFARLALSTLTSLVVAPGCSKPGDYTEDDVAGLTRRMRVESAASGAGPYGEQRFRGYRGLAELPYFEIGEGGELRLVVDDLPAGVDFHAHLGMSLLFAPDLDLLARTPRIQYLLDCDRDEPGCDLDLDVYINSAFDEQMHAELERQLRNQLLWGGEAAATHTIPNLVAELDAMRFHAAALLPIAVGLPFGDDVTEQWLAALERSGFGDRFIAFASVHPSDRGWRERLRGFARRGVRGLKVHPEMQRVFPDEPRMMEIYQECERLGLAVIFHAGRSGIEPEFMRKYALLRRFAEPLGTFPRVQFALGHAGARDVDDAVALARRHDNVWLEITGQGVTRLDAIIQDVGTERLLFGSDWPFYPLAATLAKVLLVTEKNKAGRAAIVRHNADRILQMAASTSDEQRVARSESGE